MTADENANGDPRLIEDIDVLIDLKAKLKGIRKTSMKTSDEDELKEVKQKIVSLCVELGGVNNSKLMTELKQFVPSGNPNAIKSIVIAKDCFKALQKLK